ncbi:hypothetical protein AOLI_G00296460 [Acnodon oligacanthus]
MQLGGGGLLGRGSGSHAVEARCPSKIRHPGLLLSGGPVKGSFWGCSFHGGPLTIPPCRPSLAQEQWRDFLDTLATELGLPLKPLERPLLVMAILLCLTQAPHLRLVLGFPWLMHHNPRIDWFTQSVYAWGSRCDGHCLADPCPPCWALKAPSQMLCPDNGHLRGLIPPRNPLFPLLGSWPFSFGSWILPSGRPSDRSLILEAAPLASCMCLQLCGNECSGGDLPRPGVTRTLDFLCRWFWWPSIEKDVCAFVASCKMCTRCKAPQSRPHGLLHLLPVPAHPLSHVSLGFVTGLPPSRGNAAILVLMDCFSKACKFVTLPKLPSAKETAELLLLHVVRIHGIPRSGVWCEPLLWLPLRVQWPN